MIFKSTPKLFYNIYFFFLLFCISMLFLNKISLSNKNVLLLSICLIFYLSLYLYVSSCKIIISDEYILIKHLFKNTRIATKELIRIQLTYKYKDTNAIFPYLHLVTVDNHYYIPSMVFERNLHLIEQSLQDIVLRHYL